MADEPKIFIDEDWKARAQREKEELQKRLDAEAAAARPAARPAMPMSAVPDSDAVPAEADAAAAAGLDAQADGAPAGEEEAEGEEVYEANFEALLSSLATQTMFALGVIAQQGAEQVMVNLDQAKFTIDILVMLRDKTKGNLTDAEQTALDGTLAELQRLFVARLRQFEAQAMRQAGIDPSNIRAE